jgi:acetyl esterase/lipase
MLRPPFRCSSLRLAFLALLACSGCNGDLRAYFDADLVNTERDVTYIQGSDNPRQTLDIYTPRGLTAFPVLVFVHGGYWIGQDKNYYAPVLGLYGNVGRALAKRGVGVVVINYRLVPDVAFADQLDDVAQALRWTQQNIAVYDGDPDRIVLGGHSAGGHLTALFAFDEALLQAAKVGRPRAFAPLSPIFDLQDMADHPPDADFNQRVTKAVFGDDLEVRSPKHHFHVIETPLFVAMGDADEPYLVKQIPRAVTELERLGVPITFKELAKHTHSDVVLNFDSDDDQLSEALATFIETATR